MKSFIVLIAALFSMTIYADAQCTGNWGAPLVNQTFGQGNATDAWYGPLATYAPGASTSTTFVGASGPVGGVLSDGFSGLAKIPSASGQGNWVTTTDHTGNQYGLMFLINAPSTAATVFFEYTMDNLCPNTTLKLSVWMLNANVSSLTTNPTYQYPNMALQAVDPVTNAILGTAPSGNVPADAAWHQYSVTFNNAGSTSIKLQLVNNSVGSGFGNDLAIDDITVQPCVPISHVLPKLDTLICQNANLSFNASVLASPYNPAEYQWQYSADGGVTWLNQGAAGPNTNYNFSTTSLAAGSYLIRFKTGPIGATGNANCIAISDTSKVTISSPPVPPVIDYLNHYCTGATFVPFTIVTGTNIKWYTAIGGTPSTTAPVVNTATTGTYTWYASQTTPQGCESPAIPITVTVSQTPVADFTFLFKPGCMNDTVSFHNNSQFATDYYWDFNDGFTDISANPTHVYLNQNIYYVKLRASNQFCADSTLKSIDITHPLHASFTTSTDTLCVGSTVTFTNTSTASTLNNTAPSYYWVFADGVHSTLLNPTHTYTNPGVYNVMMVVKDGVPCTDTAYRTIFIDATPQISFTRSDTAFCLGHKVDLIPTFSLSGLDNIEWNFGDNTDRIANVDPMHHAYDAPGTYTITMYGNYRVCADVSTTAQVTVKALPVINLGRDTALCLDGAPLTVTDNMNMTNPLATWQWNTGATTPSIEVKHDGIYTATVTIDQCSSSDEIEVKKDCIIDIPNSFTPNGDGVNDYFFPRQYLSNGVTGFTMTVFDRWGQKVFETKNPNGRGWDGKFNDKNQPVGVYIYSIHVVMKNMRTEEYTGNVTLLR
jgi:gliding motility-associated-like protein